MKAKSSSCAYSFTPFFGTLLLVTLTFSSCGTTRNLQTVPQFQGNTNVTVVMSSTANSQLSEFDIGITGISLVSQSGKSVTLYSLPPGTEQGVEFIHANGQADPFLTVSVPQGIYKTATVAVDNSAFTCVTLSSTGGLATSTFAYGGTATSAPTTTVTVNLPSPITITGTGMLLHFDLSVAQSATYQSCLSQGIQPFSITPTLTLSSSSLPASATSNNQVRDVFGQITATGTNGSFSLALPASFAMASPGTPRILKVVPTAAPVFEGVSGLSSLALGMFVEIDGGIQSDGSLAASRIAVRDPGTSNMSILRGPVLMIGTSSPSGIGPAMWALGTQQQGFFLNNHLATDPAAYTLASASFQISGELPNLLNLPFVPKFDASNIVPGQNVYVTTNVTQPGSAGYAPVNTITLVPQTINGSVVGSTQAGNFTDYTIQLAPYDLFPTLAVQPGQRVLLSNPSVIEVYVDTSTQRLNTQSLALGNTLRFYGLVFNDNGTLRMDCAQVNDGVTASSQSNSAAGMVRGKTKILYQKTAGSTRKVITITSPSTKQ